MTEPAIKAGLFQVLIGQHAIEEGKTATEMPDGAGTASLRSTVDRSA
jgi:hypothetical protein